MNLITSYVESYLHDWEFLGFGIYFNEDDRSKSSHGSREFLYKYPMVYICLGIVTFGIGWLTSEYISATYMYTDKSQLQ
jgi:hypothetical protein